MAIKTITDEGAFTRRARTQINDNFTALSAAGVGGALPSADILVGNGGGEATAVAMSGDASIDNTGAVSIAPGITTHKLPAGVAAGYVIARGATALDGSNPTAVATGLTSVVAFVAAVRSTDVSTGTAYVTHGAPSGATVNLYAWQKDGSASTGTETVDWVAVGT